MEFTNETMERDERRKQRNREAAKRSYEKKKNEHEELEKSTVTKEETQIQLHRQISQLGALLQTLLAVLAGIRCAVCHGSKAFAGTLSYSAPPTSSIYGRPSSGASNPALRSTTGGAPMSRPRSAARVPSRERRRETSESEVPRHDELPAESGLLSRMMGSTAWQVQSMQSCNSEPPPRSTGRAASTQSEHVGTTSEAMIANQVTGMDLEFVQRTPQGVVTQPQSNDEVRVFTFTGDRKSDRLSNTRPEGLLACSSSAPSAPHRSAGDIFSKLVPSGEGYTVPQSDTTSNACLNSTPDILELIGDINLIDWQEMTETFPDHRDAFAEADELISNASKVSSAVEDLPVLMTTPNLPEEAHNPPMVIPYTRPEAPGPPVEASQPTQASFQPTKAAVATMTSSSGTHPISKCAQPASQEPAQKRMCLPDHYSISNPTPCSDLATTGWKMDVEKRSLAMLPGTVTGLSSFPAQAFKKVEQDGVFCQASPHYPRPRASSTLDMVLEESTLFQGTELQGMDMEEVQEVDIFQTYESEMTADVGTNEENQLSTVPFVENKHYGPAQLTTPYPYPYPLQTGLMDYPRHPDNGKVFPENPKSKRLTCESATWTGNSCVSHQGQQRTVEAVQAKGLPGKTAEGMTGTDDGSLSHPRNTLLSISDVNVKLKQRYQ